MKKYMKIWEEHAILREGKRLTVYKDSLGKPTVGIGHLVLPHDKLKVGDKITEEQARKFFIGDSQIAERAALEQAAEIGVETDDFIAALISVNFQLGIKWTKDFKTTYPAIVAHDFKTAIRNLRKSKWYKQTPVRVEDFIIALNESERYLSLKNRPLKKTRTMAGAGVASVGITASEIVSEVSEKIEPLVKYGDTIQLIFVILSLVGIGLVVYARIDDRKKNLR